MSTNPILQKRYSIGQGPLRKVTINRKVLHILVPDVVKDNAVIRSAQEIITHNSEKEDYILELKSLATELQFDPVLHLLTLQNQNQIIDSLPKDDLIVNVCDGSDIDGVPGPSVGNKTHAAYLEAKKFTGVVGCDSLFINNTLTKNGMKELFRAHLVSTPPGFPATPETDLAGEVEAYGMMYPLFVKVSDSYGSVGLDDSSVCHDYSQLKAKTDLLFKDFHNLTVEEYIDGQEYSVLVSGNCRDESQPVIVYPPAERAFDEKVPQFQRFVSFERNWDEKALVHSYISVKDPNDYMALQDLARRAYIATSGNCYGRVDIRKRDVSGKFYVLEVNASCGLGKGSSSEFILHLAGQTTQDFFKIILSSALQTIDDQNPIFTEPQEIQSDADEAVDKLSGLTVTADALAIPKTVGGQVARLISNPSLSVIPTPVVNVIVSAVQQDGTVDPEGKLVASWGKDAEYVSELENLFRGIGYDPIVHLYHVDDLDQVLSRLSPSEDLIFNACLGSDGLQVAKILDTFDFKHMIGLNSKFFEASRSRQTTLKLLRGNRLSAPSAVTIKPGVKPGRILTLMSEADIHFPVYVKPVVALSHLEGENSGRRLDSLNDLESFLPTIDESDGWILEPFYRGKSYRVLVAGDARDPNADVLVLPPAVEGTDGALISDLAFQDADTNANDTARTSVNDMEHPISGGMRRRSSFLSKDAIRHSKHVINKTLFSSMPSSTLLLQMDLQDLARRAFVAVHGSCYGLVNIIDTPDHGLVVLGVSADVRFGEDAKAGIVLNLAGLGTEDLFQWLLKRATKV